MASSLRRSARLPASDQQARLALSAYHQGGHIVIEIADDGKGLDTEKIKATAIERGLIAPGASPSADEINVLIFEPGFSTAEKVTEISGRGVGMDVVRRNIDALRGRIEIADRSRQGDDVPDQAAADARGARRPHRRRRRERFVMPTTAVRESLRPLPAHVHKVQGAPRLVQVRDSLLPLVALGELFGLPHEADPCKATVVVIEDAGSRGRARRRCAARQAGSGDQVARRDVRERARRGRWRHSGRRPHRADSRRTWDRRAGARRESRVAA